MFQSFAAAKVCSGVMQCHVVGEMWAPLDRLIRGLSSPVAKQ